MIKLQFRKFKDTSDKTKNIEKREYTLSCKKKIPSTQVFGFCFLFFFSAFNFLFSYLIEYKVDRHFF